MLRIVYFFLIRCLIIFLQDSKTCGTEKHGEIVGLLSECMEKLRIFIWSIT